jgi:murein L,D-transpeptidase YafK
MCLITIVCSLVLGLTIPSDMHAKADSVLVIKSERKLVLLRHGDVIREFSISLGSRPVGHKWEEGDQRTPEGYYVLDWRNSTSRFYRSIHVSYPDYTDRSYARMAGVDPGGNIMIHGLPNGSAWASWWVGRWDWTDGCIAVTNEAMDEIWDSVEEGTPIEIRP